MASSGSWTLVQAILLLSTLFWPLRIGLNLPAVVRWLGLCCMVGGGMLVLLAVSTLKGGFRPSLKPRAGGPLVREGLYGVVRHPAYSGIVLAAFGWSLWKADLARMALTAMLLVFFDAKSRAEEACIEQALPEYVRYKERVTRRFLPWIY